MLKIMSAIFTAGVAVGASGVLIAIRRGHMHLEPNEPEIGVDEDADRSETNGAINPTSASTRPETVGS